MRVFATVGHGATVIGLAVETLPPSLLHPIVLHVRVRHLLANPARTPACLDLAGNSRRPAGRARVAVASGTSAWRGSFASAELGQDGLGRSPEPGHGPPLRSICAGRMWPWASCFPRAGPVVIGKLRFQFSFIIWKEKCFGKCLYTQICSKFVETNFARILVTRST